MDWGWIILFGLAIVGAALIVGGVVAYRGMADGAPKGMAAAGIAAGIVMWAIVLMAAPLSMSSSESPPPDITMQTTAQ
ncbi:MAG: hypothetical protein C1O27_001685 [Chloroflexi bacterium]|jgi:hypothetical protein|nr:MAG: hypothetical protein C1O27_001685 [Chloroflexota bacterium]